MPYGGDFTPRTPGEAVTFTFDFYNDLAPGDALASVVSSALAPYDGTDASAPTLLIGGASVVNGTGTNSAVSQRIGTNPNNLAGFQPNVVYQWTIVALTTAGDVKTWYCRIPVGDALPSATGGSPPAALGSPIPLSASATLATPGLYAVKTPGVVVTLGTPLAALAAPIVVTDDTGAATPAVLIAGSINGDANGRSLGAKATLAFYWSPADAYWLQTAG